MLELFEDAISIYQTGSGVLPFINNPKDIDYIVVYPTEDLIIKHYSEFGEITKKLGNINFWTFALEDFTSGIFSDLHMLKYGDQNFKPGYLYFRTYLAPINTILLHWVKLLEGKNIELEKFIKLDNYYLVKLYHGLKSARAKFSFLSTDPVYKHYDTVKKCWYYLFIALFTYMNKSFDAFTESQIKIIQNAHDCKISVNDCLAYTDILED